MASPLSVFVVDDDEASRESIAAVAETLQLPVLSFASGEAFLAKYEGEQGGCVVLDVRLPGMNGLEVVDALLARRSLLAVVMVTAYGEVPLAVAAVKKGVFAFLQKPCRGHDLWSTLKDALAYNEQTQSEATQANDVLARLDSLTDDERHVLDMMLENIPSKTMAKRLGVSVRTVQFRRSAVYDRLQVDSVASLAMTLAGVCKPGSLATPPRLQPVG
jgi:two-component system response regulator DctR